MNRMGLSLLAAVIGLGFAPSDASAIDQADLIAKRDKKLAGPWLKNAAWILDYEEAKKESAKTGKLIFGYFTPSHFK